jgi:hypothetical protein
MPVSAIIHLLEYRIQPGHEAEVTGFLRHELLAAPLSDGLVARFAGRRLSDRGRHHFVATTWRDPAAFARAMDSQGLPAYLAGRSSLLADLVPSRYRLAASTGLGRDGAKVLRLYRTSIPAEGVEAWERRAFQTVGGLATKRGLLTAEAGVETDGEGAVVRDGNVRIAIITAWAEWDLLLAATGGRLDKAPLDIELTDVKRPATADHFELLLGEPGPV